MKRLPCALGLAATMLASAAGGAEETLTPQDFALGLPVTHDAGLPYFTVRLPALVYRTAVDPLLRDLRFFDADGQVLRHARLQPAPEAAPPAARVALPVFALSRATPSGTRETRIEIAPDGSLVSRSAAGAPQLETHAWIIDASRVHEQAETYVVEAAPGPDHYLPYVIDGSQDLGAWETGIAHGTLVRIEQLGQVLQRAGFSPGTRRHPYLRLRWQDPAQAPRLAGVHAELRTNTTRADLPLLTLAAQRLSAAPRELRFDANGHFPVCQVQLAVPPNGVLRGRLEARGAAEDDWQPVAAGEWYALRADEQVVSSVPRAIATRRARHWRFVAEDGYTFAQLPQLELAYCADEFRVLAAGAAPFLLAVGSGRAAALPATDESATALPADSLPVASELSAVASLGEAVELGGPTRRAAPPAALPWQRILLWAVLGTGVLLLGVLAWRLYRDVEHGGHTDSDTDRAD